MSRGFTLSKPAIQDLEVILEYILETGGPDAADRVASGLQTAFRKLAETPGIGHRREDLTTDDVRFFAVWSYFILYKPDSAPLEIARVIHGARDLPPLLENS